MTTKSSTSARRPGVVYTWDEIHQTHRSLNGIHHRNGRLLSLLTDFGRLNPCYPDFHGETKSIIHYTGSGRRGNQKMDAANRALVDAISSCYAVPLFNKLGVNRWEYLGDWQVVAADYVFDESRTRMVWKFTLKQADGFLPETVN